MDPEQVGSLEAEDREFLALPSVAKFVYGSLTRNTAVLTMSSPFDKQRLIGLRLLAHSDFLAASEEMWEIECEEMSARKEQTHPASWLALGGPDSSTLLKQSPSTVG